MKKANHKKMYRDLALVTFFLLLAGVLFIVLRMNQDEGTGVIIRVDGQEVARYSFSQEGRYELNGGTNILMIEDGNAWLTDADCPDKLCVRQGKISVSGQVITCLPNRLTVTVYGVDGGVDIVL